MPNPATDRIAAVLGLLGVAGNVAGVLFLHDVPVAYRPTDIDRWAALSAAHPQATLASAVTFILGLLALAGWAAGLGRRAATPGARFGAASVAAGALLNAAGCVAPLVLVTHVLPGCAGDACGPVARALLGVTLSLDALFNLLLGIGLLALGAALWRRGERGVAVLGIVAGLGRRTASPGGRFGAASIAAGALLNAAGCVAPLVLVAHVLPGCDPAACAPVARALLGVTLSLDALFNLLLGLGLLALGGALWRRGERAVGVLGIVAGLASLPVAGQPFSDGSARLLALAGPLWLAFVLWTSARMWRGAAGGPRP
jgi:hypothetical protein